MTEQNDDLIIPRMKREQLEQYNIFLTNRGFSAEHCCGPAKRQSIPYRHRNNLRFALNFNTLMNGATKRYDSTAKDQVLVFL
jgi:hypothetical protein